MLFSDFIKVMPLLRDGFFVKWLNKNEQNGWYSYKKFAQEYDFKRIQVVKCRNKPCFSYDSDFEFELTLKRSINEKLKNIHSKHRAGSH